MSAIQKSLYVLEKTGPHFLSGAAASAKPCRHGSCAGKQGMTVFECQADHAVARARTHETPGFDG
jgi:hypothetical protein